MDSQRLANAFSKLMTKIAVSKGIQDTYQEIRYALLRELRMRGMRDLGIKLELPPGETSTGWYRPIIISKEGLKDLWIGIEPDESDAIPQPLTHGSGYLHLSYTKDFGVHIGFLGNSNENAVFYIDSDLSNLERVLTLILEVVSRYMTSENQREANQILSETAMRYSVRVMPIGNKSPVKLPIPKPSLPTVAPPAIMRRRR